MSSDPTFPLPAVRPDSRSDAVQAAATAELPWIRVPRTMAPKDARALGALFFDRLRTLEEGTPEHAYARGTLIEMNMSLVVFCSRRFRSRDADEMQDIVQAGTIGMIKAIDRFDLSREVEFTTFAIPYIVGQMRRHFRDTSWAVHVPRRLQELRVAIAKARDHLAAVLGAPPGVAELAAYLELPEEEVIEGLIATNGYTAGSLDVPVGDPDIFDGAGTYADSVGADDPGMELFDNLHTLAPLLRTLEPRERRILELRFGQDKTQAQIGEELGLSQMHISRLLSGILRRLKTDLLS
ncbi:SigB/SigF/SigG family RNA polymerase sigma factor [Streptomyces sp. V4-01]|uniref:SigB/SigF/SigG family RNA polymerase sigma factor n=1 Tax=Actinacidiphila polyblastidii TaxID=3110430 RepID=A0ABU7PCF1_9ACTN|nr:SigB/SigF/SigG family RNA polymerase sigma factor [Streptomyces sp. V4-01]